MIRTAADTSTAAQRLARAEDLEQRAHAADILATGCGPDINLRLQQQAAAFRADAKALRVAIARKELADG
jgi:hypothetical protein